jgi:phage shock protein E
MLHFIKNILCIKDTVYKKLIQNGAQIIDVRSPQEYKLGCIKNSKNIPLQNISSKLHSFPKNKAIITVCASGMRSINAKRILTSQGFDAYNGGAWQQLQKKIS